jgi:hypothetical protein
MLPQSLKELDPELLLNHANLYADVRLNAVSPLSRSGKAEFVGENPKNIKLPQFHLS